MNDMMETPRPPVARREPKGIEQLGRARVDDYAWMKDENWQAVMRDPSALRADIRAHLETENAYTAAMMRSTEEVRERIFKEMRGRIKEDDSTLPSPDGPFAYYARYEMGAQHPRYVRKPRDAQSPEEVLLDVEALAQGKDYCSVAATGHAPDHQLFAYAVDEQGSEYYEIRLKDLARGAQLPAPIASSSGDFAFSPCARFLFWVFRDANGRPSKVFRRPARGGEDTLVYEEQDEGFFVGVGTSESRAFILIAAGNQEQSEVHLIPASDPEAAPRLFTAREPSLRYDVTHWDGRWLVRTNADGAIDFKVMECREGETARAHWRDFLAHQPGRFVLGLSAFKDFLVRLERVNALPRILIRERATGAERAIAFEEQAYDLDLESGYEFDTALMRFIYNSPTTPRRWFDYDMRTHARELRKTQEIPSGHDPALYETRRFSARAPDGADIPITALMRKGAKLDGSAPVLLYGYGAYGIPMEADFSIRRLSLVDRGWIWAIAHIRGGSEKGWGWFLDGRKEKKQNTFSDFIACAEELVARNYARAGQIVAYGGSAGGMLMGAIANMRPDLWAGIVASVPFVDVLNTMSDGSLPLTPPERPEWGDPTTDEAAYDRIAAYSPYDNVKALAYPPILATGGLSDPRVTYWEPAKWAARLRAHSTSAAPALLKINLEAGHGGASGRFDFLREIAFDYAFALKCVGSPEAGGGF
jgi:oligopeptidase B